ncbi:hypothetical protein LZ30DRAFT_744589 [Colletotrichum cereale]|nr:hypothetical protein LZ30DRAFT_744589 [Colletotrichum cereale]
MVSLIVALTYFLAAVTFAFPSNPLALKQSSTTNLVRRQAGETPRYKAVNNAAEAAGTTLNDGEWHDFRLCSPLSKGQRPANDLRAKTGCSHHYIVVGQVTTIGVSLTRKDFQGYIYHVTYGTKFSRRWSWSSHPYQILGGQRLYYGGKTIGARASKSRLDTLSTTWVDEQGSCWDLYDSNCLGFYKSIASKL